MSDDDVSEIIEICDPEIDAEAIMRQIRENIRKRRAQAEAQGLDYESFVEGLYASQVTARFDHSLYYDLRRMSVGYDKVGVGLSLTESGLPLIGPLVQRFRKALHHLVIYYTNMLAGQQARFNEYVVRALTGLVKELEEGPGPDDIAALRREVAELRARVEQMETGPGTGDE
jgi:hypothetical protein